MLSQFISYVCAVCLDLAIGDLVGVTGSWHGALALLTILGAVGTVSIGVFEYALWKDGGALAKTG